jgi:hypothetical protein
MRNLLAAITFLGFGLSAVGQSNSAPPAGSDWSHVQAITPGTKIQLLAKSGKSDCRLQGVDSDGLTCSTGTGRSAVFARPDIWKIEIVHRGRSAALAGGIGVGLGFGIDVALSKGVFQGGKVKGNVAVASGAAGGLVLAPLGYFGGWIRETVYTAPPSSPALHPNTP